MGERMKFIGHSPFHDLQIDYNGKNVQRWTKYEIMN